MPQLTNGRLKCFVLASSASEMSSSPTSWLLVVGLETGWAEKPLPARSHGLKPAGPWAEGMDLELTCDDAGILDKHRQSSESKAYTPAQQQEAAEVLGASVIAEAEDGIWDFSSV